MALHLIPDDGCPHSPTSECGCGPQRSEVRPDGRVGATYTHTDQRPDQGDELAAGDER